MNDDKKETQKANCVDVTYDGGSHTTVQGVKNNEKTRINPDGTKFTPLGHGVGKVTRNTQLVLTAEIDNDHEEIWIGRFFKDKWGNLTQKRRDAIRASMPDTININMNGEYPAADEEDLNAWLNRAKGLVDKK